MDFIIPLTNYPQTFEIALAGRQYLITCRWNDAADAGWFLNIADAVTEQVIITNVPLVTGQNLLDGLSYLGIDGELYVLTDGDTLAVPTYDNLGIDSNLYFRTDNGQ